VAIGHNSNCSTFSNCVAIGKSATNTASNQIVLGNTNITEIKTNGKVICNGVQVNSTTDVNSIVMANGTVDTTLKTDVSTLKSSNLTKGRTESLTIIRGNIDLNGNIVNGSGFTITKGLVGIYTINITTAFSTIPSVCLTLANTYVTINTYNLTVSSIVVNMRNNANTIFNSNFSFIAVG
jgi:hypothetical protein